MPAQPAYITQNRHGTFYFRIVVPSPLRSALGLQREIRRSLRTDSQRLALRRARQYAARYEAAFDKVLTVLDQDHCELTDEEVERYAEQIHQAVRAEAYGSWSTPPTEPDRSTESSLTDAEWQALDEQQRRAAVAIALTGSSKRSIPEPQRALAEQLYVAGRSLPARKFRQLIPKLIDELTLKQLRPAGEACEVVAPASQQACPTLYELWGQHWEKLSKLARGAKQKAERTKEDEHGHACRLNILSGNKPINLLTLDDFNRIYLQLFDICTSRGKKLPSPDSPPDSILAKEDQARISSKTVEKLSVRLNVLHTFAHDKGLTLISPRITERPLIDHNPPGTKPEVKAFTNSDLAAIFSGYIYTGTNIGESKKLFPYQFWLPLLGLYTGGRLNELCQIDTKDISQDRDSGIWTIDIMDEPDDKPHSKSLKNKPSRRIMPIHSELIRMGLLEFVDHARCEGRLKLFSDGLTYNPKKGWGGIASTFYCRFPSPSTPSGGYFFNQGIRTRDTDGKTDSKNFHSFRHTFTDLTRAAGPEAYMIAPDLTGHSRGKEGQFAKYGNGFALERKKAVLESLPLPVDLSTISYADFELRLGYKLAEGITSHRAKFGLNQSELQALPAQ